MHARQLVDAGPGQRVVPPFGGDPVWPAMHLAVHHDPAANAGAQDHSEHHAIAGTGAIDRLAQREAVGVVVDPHLAAQLVADVAIECVPVQRDGVGVFHAAGGRADHAGDSDPDRDRLPSRASVSRTIAAMPSSVAS